MLASIVLLNIERALYAPSSLFSEISDKYPYDNRNVVFKFTHDSTMAF